MSGISPVLTSSLRGIWQKRVQASLIELPQFLEESGSRTVRVTSVLREDRARTVRVTSVLREDRARARRVTSILPRKLAVTLPSVLLLLCGTW